MERFLYVQQLQRVRIALAPRPPNPLLPEAVKLVLQAEGPDLQEQLQC